MLESTETNQDDIIDVIPINQVEEEVIDDDVLFSIIEDSPIFTGCKGNKAE